MTDQIEQRSQDSNLPTAERAFVPPILPPAAVKPSAPTFGDRMILPVGRSDWAIAAGYAGLFCLVVVPGPIALPLSIIAIFDLQKHRRKHGWGRAIFGLITGSLATLFLAHITIAWFVDLYYHGV